MGSSIDAPKVASSSFGRLGFRVLASTATMLDEEDIFLLDEEEIFRAGSLKLM